MKRLGLLAAMALVLTMALAPAPASARVQCYEENYGNGTCATTCVIYNNATNNVDGWGTMEHAC